MPTLLFAYLAGPAPPKKFERRLEMLKHFANSWSWSYRFEHSSRLVCRCLRGGENDLAGGDPSSRFALSAWPATLRYHFRPTIFISPVTSSPVEAPLGDSMPLVPNTILRVKTLAATPPSSIIHTLSLSVEPACTLLSVLGYHPLAAWPLSITSSVCAGYF